MSDKIKRMAKEGRKVWRSVYIDLKQWNHFGDERRLPTVSDAVGGRQVSHLPCMSVADKFIFGAILNYALNKSS